MKTPSILAIAIEALVTVSLIALLGLLTALIYALLSFLSAEPTTQSVLSQIPTDVTTAKTFTGTFNLGSRGRGYRSFQVVEDNLHHLADYHFSCGSFDL
jgi:hypothetical protein